MRLFLSVTSKPGIGNIGKTFLNLHRKKVELLLQLQNYETKAVICFGYTVTLENKVFDIF